MRKILLVMLLLVSMSAAAQAADKPTIAVVNTTQYNEGSVDDVRYKSFIVELQEVLYTLDDVIISELFDSQKFTVMELESSDLTRSKYLVLVNVPSIVIDEVTLDNGLKVYKTKIELKLSMGDSATNKIFLSSTVRCKVRTEGSPPAVTFKHYRVLDKASRKAVDELIRKYEALER